MVRAGTGVNPPEARAKRALIDVGRALLAQAFRNPAIVSPSALSQFRGAKRVKSPKPAQVAAVVGECQNCQRPKLQLIAGFCRVCNPLGAHVTTASEGRPAKYSTPVLPGQDKISGRVRVAITRQPLIQQALVNFLYRSDGPARAQYAECFDRLYRMQYSQAHMGGAWGSTAGVVRRMITFRVAQLASPHLLHQTGYHPKGINARNWRQTYARHWLRISQEISDLDDQVCIAVAKPFQESKLNRYKI